MRFLVSVLLWLSFAAQAATTLYVKAGSSGTGADWSSPLGSISSQGSGNTYYVAAGTYSGAVTLTSANQTVKKATVADHGTDTGWSDSFASGQAVFSVGTSAFTLASGCTLDGQTGGGPGNWTGPYGIKVVCAQGAVCQGVVMASVNNATIKHCEIEGDHGDNAGCGSNNDCVQNNSHTTGLTLSSNYLHHAGRCLVVTRGDNFTMEYIYGGTYEYYDPGDHSEILVADAATFPSSPDCVNYRTNIVIRNCLFTYVYGTGGLMLQADGVDIYGNVFYQAPNQNNWSYSNDGCVAGGHDSGALIRNVHIYHNTFIDATRLNGPWTDPSIGVVGQYVSTGWNPCNAGNSAYNNLFILQSNPRLDFCQVHDYNGGINLSAGVISEPHGQTISASGNGLVNAPNYDFHTVSNFPGGTLPAGYNNTDPQGVARSTHTRGAYEFGGSNAPAATILVTPGQMFFPVQLTNISTLQTGVVANTGTLSLTGSVSGLSSPFTLSSGSGYTVATNANTNFVVTFNPSTGGGFSQTATFSGGGGQSINVTGVAYIVQAALTFQADVGTVLGPFVTNAGKISQPGPTYDYIGQGGLALYGFNISQAGTYWVSNVVTATNLSNDSVWWAIDAMPTNDYQIWKQLPVSASAQTVSLSWRGNGNATSNQFPAVQYTLGTGVHTLYVVGREGGMVMGQWTITKQSTNALAPTADFSAGPTNGAANLLVTFTNLSANANAYVWQFGDGASSTQVSPQHTYVAGSYDVILSASGPGGTSAKTNTGYIVVTNQVILPTANFTTGQRTGSAPFTVYFTNTSANAAQYAWDFGDLSAGSAATNPTHVYLTAGTNTVILSAANGTNSASKTNASYINVTNPPTAVASFTMGPLSGTAPLRVWTTNNSTSASNQLWSFGDGKASILTSPTNTYTNAGSYTVSLTVWNAGGTNTQTRVNYVVPTNATAVAANFSGGPLGGTAPLTVCFTNSSSGATNFTWRFGDGSTSTAQNPCYTYTNAGTYDVSLTAVGLAGSNAKTNTSYVAATNGVVTLNFRAPLTLRIIVTP